MTRHLREQDSAPVLDTLAMGIEHSLKAHEIVLDMTQLEVGGPAFAVSAGASPLASQNGAWKQLATCSSLLECTFPLPPREEKVGYAAYCSLNLIGGTLPFCSTRIWARLSFWALLVSS